MGTKYALARTTLAIVERAIVTFVAIYSWFLAFARSKQAVRAP